MKENVRTDLLRILAAATVSAFIYSAVLVLRTALFGGDGGLALALLYLALACAGFAAGRVLLREGAGYAAKIAGTGAAKFLMFTFEIKEKERFIASAAAFATFPLPVLAAVLAGSSHGVLRTVFEIPASILLYFMAQRNSNRSFDEILRRNSAYAGLLVIAAALEAAAFYSPVSHLKVVLFAILYFCMLSFLVLGNQEDIDSNIYSRKHIEKSILPGNLRSFNLKAVIVLFAVILVLFYLKPIVVFLINIAAKLIFLLLEAIGWILAHILGSQQQQGQQGAQQPNSGFFGGDASGIHPFLNLITNTFMYFIILYAAYLIVRLLIRKLPAMVRAVSRALKKFFAQVGRKEDAAVRDYSDEVETVIPDKDTGRRAMKKHFRKTVKDLKYITDPVERLRYMYGSILSFMAASGLKPDKSDTTAEILSRAKAVSGLERPLAAVTRLYEDVRYGEAVPDMDALADAAVCYRETSELLRKGSWS